MNKNGVIAGSFDLIHPGYVRMFREAKEKACDRLIVLLQDDPTIDRPSKCKPVQTWEERAEVLLSMKDVDEVWKYCTERELQTLLESHKEEIHVRILGSDYVGKSYTGEKTGIPVYFCDRNHEYSLTDLKRKVYFSMHGRQ
jgi:glycerol-3-phosphate cytidylyltransferase